MGGYVLKHANYAKHNSSKGSGSIPPQGNFADYAQFLGQFSTRTVQLKYMTVLLEYFNIFTA